MAFPRYLQPLLDHLPKEPSLARTEMYNWIYSRVLKEYVAKLVGITQVKEDSLIKYRTELNTLFGSLMSLSDQLAKRSDPSDDNEDIE